MVLTFWVFDDVMIGGGYANRNDDRSCQEECFDNVFNSGSTQEHTSNLEEIVERREGSSVDVQIDGNGSAFTTRLSAGGHDMVDITIVPVLRIFDRFRSLGSNPLGSDSISQTAVDNPFNDCSIQENIPIPEENDGKYVQIHGNGNNVTTCLESEGHDMVDITVVPVSRIFERFRNLGSNTLRSDSMSQAGKESEFLEHHFNFTAYNQLHSKIPYRDEDLRLLYPILTVEMLLWDDLEKQFKKDEIEQLPRPIIIAVSSCRVAKYRDVQLETTPTTFYYINPQTKEDADAYKMFKEKYEVNPPLQVCKYRCVDPEQEKTRNRQTLYALLQQDPTGFKGVRFTCEAMITNLNKNRSWNYASCSQCNKASTKRSGTYICEDHKNQDPPTYRYNFKATVTDGTATAEFTFFTEAGQKMTGHTCSHLREKFETTDKIQLPIKMVNMIGKKHIFQIQFAPSTQKGSRRFIVNDVLDIKSPVEKTNTGAL
nr:hypothetical protein [Tanacetum cinerariifolium]